MPLYEILCDAGHKFEAMIPLADFDLPLTCACQSPARRLISRPMIAVESVSYECPITGDYIGSKRDHENNLRRHDCRVMETGEKDYNERRRVQEEARFDAAIEATVEKEVLSRDSDARESLAKALTTSDISVDRL